MPLKLVAIAGDRSLVLPNGRPLLVGRALACDLALSDPTVSRRHAEVELFEGSVLLRDLGSTNGTFVNHERVREAVAPPGARIGFGKVEFDVAAEADEPPPPDPAEESNLDATILRQMPVRGAADLAGRLSEVPYGPSLLLIDGDSTIDRQARKLDLLLDIAKELSQQAEVGRLLEKVVDVAFQVMSVDRVAILFAGPEGALVPQIWRSRGERPDREWHVPRSIARRAVAERAAFLIENVPADLRFGDGTVHRQEVQSALCAPLLGGQGDVLGLIYLDNLGATHSFSGEDLEFLAAFAGMISVAIENSRLVERVRREAVVLSNFQRYFAPDLARQIVDQEGKIQLGGAKRRVAILFADIRGFTSLSERMNPDEIARLLTRFFTEMVEIVFEHGGMLDKFIGDALMALWGAPLGHDDDVDRATQAALAMQRRLLEVNREMAGEGHPQLEIGIGIDVGDVFAGNIGSERRLEYTVIGDAVNTAARLCAEASPGEVLISGSLYRSLAVPPPVDVLLPLVLKGKTQAVPVYRVDWKAERPEPPRAGPGDATTSGTVPVRVRPLLDTKEFIPP